MYRSTLYFSADQSCLLLKLNGVNYWLMCNLIVDYAITVLHILYT